MAFSAYVDDISAPITQGHGHYVAHTVQGALALIGYQLNIITSEALPKTLPPLPRPPHPNTTTLCPLPRLDTTRCGSFSHVMAIPDKHT